MRITNDGQRIVSTDYWESEHAARGLLYLSTNAGALRLLVPVSGATLLREIAHATRAAVQLADAARLGVVHLVFEDDTEAPYVASLDVRQCDRSLPATEVGHWVTLDLYTRAGDDGADLVRTLPAIVRTATPSVDARRVPAPPFGGSRDN